MSCGKCQMPACEHCYPHVEIARLRAAMDELMRAADLALTMGDLDKPQAAVWMAVGTIVTRAMSPA